MAPAATALLAALAAIPLLAPPARAELITTGSVSPSPLPATTTNQIFVGINTGGSIEVNAGAAGNGITAVTGNAGGSISAIAGFGATGAGTISVIGDGSAGSASFTGARSLQFGFSGGTGTVSVQSGGLVQSLGAGDGITFGNTNSTGIGTVDGANSVLSAAGRINVGGFDGATGSLTITNGGLVQNTTGPGAPPDFSDMLIGGADGASGSVTVTGTGSRLVTGGLIVGHQPNSTASLTISDGGAASADTLGTAFGGGLSIGTGATVTVTGAGSTLEVAPIAAPHFLSGREVSIFSNGTLLVEQSAVLDAAGAGIQVGGLLSTPAAPATLTVRNGATVTAADVFVNQGGLLDGGGGTINGNVTLAGGTIAPGNSPGTMFVGGDLNLLDGILELEIGALASDAFDVAGNVVLGADLIISLIFLDAPAPGVEIDIAGFFTGAQAIDFTAFDLDTQLSVAGLGAGDFATVRLGNDTVAIGAPPGTDVPAPASLALLLGALAGFGLAGRRRR